MEKWKLYENAFNFHFENKVYLLFGENEIPRTHMNAPNLIGGCRVPTYIATLIWIM